MAHDRRIGVERWYWLANLPEEALDWDLELQKEGTGVSLEARSLPALQRVGDLVVYVSASSGTLLGIGEIMERPYWRSDGSGSWRVRTKPRFVAEIDRAPTLDDVGMEIPRLTRQIEKSQYERLERLIASAVAASQGPEHDARRLRSQD